MAKAWGAFKLAKCASREVDGKQAESTSEQAHASEVSVTAALLVALEE